MKNKVKAVRKTKRTKRNDWQEAGSTSAGHPVAISFSGAEIPDPVGPVLVFPSHPDVSAITLHYDLGSGGVLIEQPRSDSVVHLSRGDFRALIDCCARLMTELTREEAEQ